MSKHRFDAISFVFGVVFVAVAGFAVSQESLDANVTHWVWSAALIVLGAGLLASTLRAGRDSQHQEDES